MEFLFAVFAIVYAVYGLPVPPTNGIGTAKFIVGVIAIVLFVLILLGVVPRHG